MGRESDLRLTEAPGFGAQELAANRDGYMTKRQRVLLSQERALWRWLYRDFDTHTYSICLDNLGRVSHWRYPL